MRAAALEADLVAPASRLAGAKGHRRAMTPGHDDAAGGKRAEELEERDGRACLDRDRHRDAFALQDAPPRDLVGDPMIEGGGAESERDEREEQGERGHEQLRARGEHGE